LCFTSTTQHHRSKQTGRGPNVLFNPNQPIKIMQHDAKPKEEDQKAKPAAPVTTATPMNVASPTGAAPPPQQTPHQPTQPSSLAPPPQQPLPQARAAAPPTGTLYVPPPHAPPSTKSSQPSAYVPLKPSLAPPPSAKEMDKPDKGLKLFTENFQFAGDALMKVRQSNPFDVAVRLLLSCI
jgi:hypothetical protein